MNGNEAISQDADVGFIMEHPVWTIVIILGIIILIFLMIRFFFFLNIVYHFLDGGDKVMFFKRPKRVVLQLMPEELSLMLKAFIDWRNKLIEEDKPLEDVDALILKLYSKLEAC